MFENRKNCKICPKIIRNKNEETLTKHVYEDNFTKTERTFIIDRSGCEKTFLKLSLLKDKNPDVVFIICKTDNQYLSKYYHQSGETLPLDDYDDKTIVFDDMLGSNEAKEIGAFFTRCRYQILDIYYISQSWYELPKNNIRNNCSRIVLFPQSLKDITMIYNDISGLHTCFSEWRNACQEAWQKRYNYTQID